MHTFANRCCKTDQAQDVLKTSTRQLKLMKTPRRNPKYATINVNHAETEAAIDMIEWQARPRINRIGRVGDVRSMIDGRGRNDDGMLRRREHT